MHKMLLSREPIEPVFDPLGSGDDKMLAANGANFVAVFCASGCLAKGRCDGTWDFLWEVIKVGEVEARLS